MALYVIVRHEADDQSYSNEWEGDKLMAITTRLSLCKKCEAERKKKKRVYIHRCGSKAMGTSPTIIASALVESVDSRDIRVRFKDHEMMNEPTPQKGMPGKIDYDDDPL